MSLSSTESFLCYMEACKREKRKHVVPFLLEYPPSENLCEERGDMPKQTSKLFIVAAISNIASLDCKTVRIFAYSSSLPNSQAEGLG